MIKTFVLGLWSILLISNSAIAGLKNLAVDSDTVTSYSFDSNSYRINGGYAGDSGECATVTGSATCNSCTSVTNLCSVSTAICNPKSVYDSLKMKFTFQVDTVPANAKILVKFSGDVITLGSSDASQTLAANTDLFVYVSWQALREKTSLTSANGTYQDTLSIGITNGTSSDTFGASQDITVTYRGVDSTSTLAQFHSDGTSATDHECTSTEGFCSFSVVDGDSKVYLSDLSLGGTDPVSYVKWKSLQLYYREGACTGASSFCSVNPATDSSKTIDISSYDSDSLTMTSNKVENLTNETQYLFVIASQDETGNIGNFSNPTQLQCDFHSGTPGEVVGLLKNKKCFIATAAYGSTMDEHVGALRLFRDEILGSFGFSKEWIKFYYKYSPQLADVIATNNFLKQTTRIILWPLVYLAKFSVVLKNSFGPWAGMISFIGILLLGFLGIILLIIRNKKNKFLKPISAVVLFMVLFYNSSGFSQEQNLNENKNKNSENSKSTYNLNESRFPEYEPYFKKPTETGKDETISVKHPDAAKGLIKIKKDGSYIYRSKAYEKDKAGSLKIGGMLPPKISDNETGVSYENMYGKNNIIGFYMDFEWQFLKSPGKMGLIFGTGLSVASGKGTMVRTGEVGQAQESYMLFMLPVTLLLNYRFEYSDRQWIVPFVNGGGTYFGLLENRDDNKRYFAATPAASAGGGVHISMTKWDHENHFRLANEYNIADLWLTLEARALKGLNENIDFTTTYFSMGVTVDFK